MKLPRCSLSFLGLSLLLVGLLVGLSSCGSFQSSKPKLSTAELVSHTGYSTVALVRYDTDNDDEDLSDIKVYCSAVWIDNTHILTAKHCVDSIREELQDKQDEKEKQPPSCDPLSKLFGMCNTSPVEHKTIALKGLAIHYVQWKEADDPGKEPTAWHLSKVVGWSSSHDLALLEAQGKAIPGHQIAKLADEVPALGEPVEAVGHVKGLYWTFLQGTIAAYRGSLPHMEKTVGPFIQVQVPIYFGNSGGGLFNERGELIGIADFLYRNLPSEGFYIHLDSLKDFLDSRKLTVLEDIGTQQ